GTIRQKWGKLTDNDLALIDGKREQLEGVIQERYGLAKDQARKDVDTWLKSLP
ncbi:MAG: CsbD family protein, partial [Xanthobacteraceae bacterium]